MPTFKELRGKTKRVTLEGEKEIKSLEEIKNLEPEAKTKTKP